MLLNDNTDGGLLINKYKETIEKPICINEPKEAFNKIPYFLQKGTIDYKCDFIFFIDIETKNSIGINSKYMYIPVIKELSYIITDNKYNIIDEEINVNIVSYYDVLSKLIYMLKKYENAILIAHNGYMFDFKIILAYFIRYMPEHTNIYRYRKFADSYSLAKEQLHMINTYTNTNLFKYYNKYYKDEANLIYNAHTAIIDCKMMRLWVKYSKLYINKVITKLKINFYSLDWVKVSLDCVTDCINVAIS